MSEWERMKEEENRRAARRGILALLAFWTVLITIALLLLPYCAEARSQVYLEDEQDLGNGYKLCIYSEGVTITVPAYRLCPISINVED